METVSICRCCLTEGVHKDLNSTYTWLDKKEIYSDMLLECFNIVLSQNNCNNICEVCVIHLRDSLNFKQQVVRAELDFIQQIKDNRVAVDPDQQQLDVKLEPKPESDEDESDNYFLADTVREASPDKKYGTKQSQKVRPKHTRERRKEMKKEGDWRAEQIKTLVTKLASSMNSCDITTLNGDEMKSITKKRKSKITISKEAKINLMWTSRGNHDKIKHRENLLTILQFSNATPFKNKSLLGFICGYCDSTYPDPADLRIHTEKDHKKERLEFKSSFNMTEYNVKLDITDLSCSLCDDKMENLKKLKDHLVKIHDKTFYNDIKDHIVQFKLKKGDVYDCAMCSSTYETFKMLKQHMNKHYSNYICGKCNSSFATKRSLNVHRTTHQEGSFKCDHCEKIFSTRTKKQYHEKTKHLGARNVGNCPFCNEPFRSYYQRNQHLVRVHNSEAQYKCNVCDKAYILKSLLMGHIKKNHLMERNCQCTECGFRFYSKKALKAHMIKHTGEKIYTCEVCHKSYARKYTLREHMRIHNNDRRFKCEVCSMTFVQKCSLKSHLLSHHGISMAASDITSI